MAHVLVLTLVYPPDSVSTAQIVGDLATDLRRLGHDVTVITTTPHYNRDPEAEARQPLSRSWGRLVQRSMHGLVPVYHTWMPAKSRSVPARLAAWCLFHALSLVVGITRARRVDAIIAPSPPLTTGIVAWLLGVWHRAPFIYNVQEVYPDIAINLGAIRNPTAIRALFALERFVYARASHITVIAERMRTRLLDKGVEAARVSVVPNFIDPDSMQSVPAPNDFTREHGLDDRFIVTYAGNMGPAQGLDALLDAARLLADQPAIVLVLVGGGTSWEVLAARARNEGIANVRMIEHQPFSRVPEIYGASHLSVVAQAAATGADAVPSKVYRIMACGRPILAITEAGSDLAGLVADADAGFVVPQNDARALASVIQHAHSHQEQLERMGERGRRHVVAHYARASITARYDALISAVCVSRRNRQQG